MIRRRVWAIAAFLLGLLLPCAQAATAYSIAVVPRLPPAQLYSQWRPLLDELARLTGTQLELKFYPRRRDFEADFSRGTPDFLYLSPYHLVMAKRAQGYLPMLRGTDLPLAGVLVVREDSPISQLKDLAGSEVAFADPNAFAGSLYIRAMLAEQEKIAIRPVYVHSHANAFRSVIFRRTPAGGGALDMYLAEPGSAREQLRILYRTPDLPQHALAVHPRVPDGIRRAISAAILQLARQETGQRLLLQARLGKPVLADYATDYQFLERLGLERYLGEEE